MDDIQQALERMNVTLADRARAQAAFGEPRSVGERTVIPVAQVRYAFGGGGGGGVPTDEVDIESPPSMGGFGGGTLGGASVRPIAVIEVTADSVRVRPIPDIQTIMTRAFGFAALALFAGLVLGRRRQGQRGMLSVRFGNVGRIGSPQVRLGAPRFSCAPRALFGRAQR